MSGSATVVVGDATTTRGRAARRWRRSRGWVVVLGVLLVVALIAALPAPRTSATPLAPDNVGQNGARAAAQILGRQGVDVTYVRTIAAAEDAATEGTTLLVASDLFLTPDMADRIAATRADLVLASATTWLPVLAPGVDDDALGPGEPTVRSARCDDADAVAAGTIQGGGALSLSSAAWTGCFPDQDGRVALAVGEVDGRSVAVLADATPMTNGALPFEGNAALVLRLLGQHRDLVWYVPSSTDAGLATGEAAPSMSDLLPPWARMLLLQALLVVLVVALWRGRRLGPVVAERLPVVVPAAETTRGRGRLYRRARSYGHAAAALRAGAAMRMAARLGLPRSADATATIDAVARASGRPATDVAQLLYGPPPTDDGSLADLARALDHLESEVHRS